MYWALISLKEQSDCLTTRPRVHVSAKNWKCQLYTSAFLEIFVSGATTMSHTVLDMFFFSFFLGGEGHLSWVRPTSLEDLVRRKTNTQRDGY